jgi:hypothetical protein
MHALWPCSMPVRIAVLRGLYRLDRKAFVGQIGAQIRKLTGTVKPLSRALPLDRVRMKRVVVTPTRVLLFPEVIETSNRVLRQWPAYMGRFLRVTFADEDGPLRVTRRIGEADHMVSHSADSFGLGTYYHELGSRSRRWLACADSECSKAWGVGRRKTLRVRFSLLILYCSELRDPGFSRQVSRR